MNQMNEQPFKKLVFDKNITIWDILAHNKYPFQFFGNYTYNQLF